MEKFDYAWDQTPKSVTIYISYEHANDAEVDYNFGETSLAFRVRAGEGWKELKIPNLCRPINVDKSKLTVKADRFQIKLVKVEAGEWSALDDDKDRKKKIRDQRVASGDLASASTQELLADMYANATDEERASLRQAAAEGAKKREANNS